MRYPRRSPAPALPVHLRFRRRLVPGLPSEAEEFSKTGGAETWAGAGGEAFADSFAEGAGETHAGGAGQAFADQYGQAAGETRGEAGGQAFADWFAEGSGGADGQGEGQGIGEWTRPGGGETHAGGSGAVTFVDFSDAPAGDLFEKTGAGETSLGGSGRVEFTDYPGTPVCMTGDDVLTGEDVLTSECVTGGVGKPLTQLDIDRLLRQIRALEERERDDEEATVLALALTV